MAAVKSEERFLCSICLELFTEPVSTPCGHNFCKCCLSQNWDTSAPCRCPLCNELFHIKPELRVNTLLSELVSQFKQETGSKSEVCGSREVFCDHCSSPKLKALKSCLVCLSSYCEIHLQPHLSLPGLKSHQLMEPVEHMEDRLCFQHHRPLEFFCHSDQSLLCTMCALLEHKSHEFAPLNDELEQRKQKIQEIQSSVQLSQRAAEREESLGLRAFTALTESVLRSRDKFIQDLQDKQKRTQTQAEALVKQLKQEICELEQKSTEADQLQHSQNDPVFLHSCALPSPGLKNWNSVRLELEMFQGMATQALTELGKTVTDEIKNIALAELKYAQQCAVDLTLDTNTAYVNLSVSKDLKQVYDVGERMFKDSPQRFVYRIVLTKQSFSSGRFYFEVEVKDKLAWTIGVVKESVDRKKRLGLNIKYGYWCICKKSSNAYFVCVDTNVPLSLKSRPQKVGVFVDYDEGLVSFYDVQTADLIYSFTGCYFREKIFPFLNPHSNNDDDNATRLVLTTVEK